MPDLIGCAFVPLDLSHVLWLLQFCSRLTGLALLSTPLTPTVELESLSLHFSFIKYSVYAQNVFTVSIRFQSDFKTWNVFLNSKEEHGVSSQIP